MVKLNALVKLNGGWRAFCVPLCVHDMAVIRQIQHQIADNKVYQLKLVSNASNWHFYHSLGLKTRCPRHKTYDDQVAPYIFFLHGGIRLLHFQKGIGVRLFRCMQLALFCQETYIKNLKTSSRQPVTKHLFKFKISSSIEFSAWKVRLIFFFFRFNDSCLVIVRVFPASSSTFAFVNNCDRSPCDIIWISSLDTQNESYNKYQCYLVSRQNLRMRLEIKTHEIWI